MEFGELPIGEHMHTGRFFSKLIKPKKGDHWSSDQYQLVRSTGIWRECVCVCVMVGQSYGTEPLSCETWCYFWLVSELS